MTAKGRIKKSRSRDSYYSDSFISTAFISLKKWSSYISRLGVYTCMPTYFICSFENEMRDTLFWNRVEPVNEYTFRFVFSFFCSFCCVVATITDVRTFLTYFLWCLAMHERNATRFFSSAHGHASRCAVREYSPCPLYITQLNQNVSENEFNEVLFTYGCIIWDRSILTPHQLKPISI